jgi:hypothetical protein
VLSGLHLYHQHRSGVHVAYDFAAELLRLAERRQDPAACAVGHNRLAVSAMHGGNHQLAVAHFEHAFAFYDLADRRSPVFLALSDIRVAAAERRLLSFCEKCGVQPSLQQPASKADQCS